MAQISTRTITASADSVTATGWIPLNINQEDFHVGFSVINLGPDVVPVTHITGTMTNTIANNSVAATRIFTLVSASQTSASGTIIVGEVSFPVFAIRLGTVSDGSGTSTLEFNVAQTGKV